MLVVHNDRSGITNLNAVIQIRLDSNWIRAFDIGGGNHLLATYTTEDRARAVFQFLTEACRVTKGDDVILLPEE